MKRYKSLFKEKDEKYNGYTNYETHNVGLWVDNEESLYKKVTGALPIKPEDLKKIVQKAYPKGTPDMDKVSDYKKVNWKELSDEYNEEN